MDPLSHRPTLENHLNRSRLTHHERASAQVLWARCWPVCELAAKGRMSGCRGDGLLMEQWISSSAGRRWRVIRTPVDHPLPKVIKVPWTTSTITGTAAGWRPNEGIRTVIVLTSLLAVQYCQSTPPFPGGGGGCGSRATRQRRRQSVLICAQVKHGPPGNDEPRRAALFLGQPTFFWTPTQRSRGAASRPRPHLMSRRMR